MGKGLEALSKLENIICCFKSDLKAPNELYTADHNEDEYIQEIYEDLKELEALRYENKELKAEIKRQL